MGSLDVSSAKQQFFQLVDAISASHLPSFTIWLDAKLAEYKTIGQLKPDSEYESKEQYPEWIGKALRQNLSFLFPGSSQTSSSGKDHTPAGSPVVRKRISSHSSDIGTEKKRKKQTCVVGQDAAEAEDDVVMIVKEEPGGKEETDYCRVTETPLPGIRSTFSLSTEQRNNFPSGQSAAFPFTTPSKRLTSSPATMTPLDQTSSSSLPRPSFPDNTHTQQGSSSKRLNFDGASAQPLPLFSPSAVAKKLEDSPQLSAPSPGDASAAYPVSSGAGQSSDAEGSEGGTPQGITDEAVQVMGRRARTTQRLGWSQEGMTRAIAAVKSGRVGVRKAASDFGPRTTLRRWLGPATPIGTQSLRKLQDIIAKHHGGKPSYLLTSSDVKKSSSGRFCCPICAKESAGIVDYKRHFVRHTNENPFKCPYCSKYMKSVNNCYSHQMRKHPEKPRIKVNPTV